MNIPPAIHETDELYNSQYLHPGHDITLEIIKNELKSIEEEARWTQNILIPIIHYLRSDSGKYQQKELITYFDTSSTLHFLITYIVINYKNIITFYEIACS